MNYGGQCGGNFKYFWRYSTNVKRRINLGVRTCEFFFVFFHHNSPRLYATPEHIELSLHLASWTEVGPKRTFNNSRTCITLRGQPRGMAGWPFDRSRTLDAGSTDKGFHKKRYTTNTVYFDFGRDIDWKLFHRLSVLLEWSAFSDHSIQVENNKNRPLCQ